MSDTFNTINDRPIFWTDSDGDTHRCEGAEIHPGVRLLWTRCEHDVPANSAFLPGDGDAVTCPRCQLGLHPASEACAKYSIKRDFLVALRAAYTAGLERAVEIATSIGQVGFGKPDAHIAAVAALITQENTND